MDANFNVRCRLHDYRSRCIYQITMNCLRRLPPLTRIYARQFNGKLAAGVEVLPLGRLVYDCMDTYFKPQPSMRILVRSVMPDHIHFVLYVHENLDKSLGTYIGEFSSLCTTTFRRYLSAGADRKGADSAFWRDLRARLPQDADLGTQVTTDHGRPEEEQNRIAIFQIGFNDRIARRRGAKDSFCQYVLDNPYRHIVRKMHPEFFCNNMAMQLGDRKLQLYGNILLLDNPDKAQVQISRRPEKRLDLPRRMASWEETIRQRGVLVSPFISPEEREWQHKAIKGNAGIILVVNYEFRDRFKPYKSLFELCEQGRLLMVTTATQIASNVPMTRPEALDMNAIAAQLATLPVGASHQLLLKRLRPLP